MKFVLRSTLTAWACLSFIAAVHAQAPAGIWQDVPEPALAAARNVGLSKRTVLPLRFRTLRADQAALANALAQARPESESDPDVPPAEIALPMPDGTFARFEVRESPIMAPGLAKKFPTFRTYAIRGIDSPQAVGRLDQTPRGFHAIIQDGVATTYIDPYWRDETGTYLSYRRRDYRNASKNLNCFVRDPARAFRAPLAENAFAARPTGAQLRTYRTAVACTGEYAAAAGGGTVLGALSAIVTTVNRVSAMYERDLAIRLRLIDNEDAIIFTNPVTDGFTDDNPDDLIDESQTKIDAIIGNANYDIGHTFSTGGGGLANVGVVGRTGLKATGVTGSENPVGDPYDIDYVAHEMGHQFGAGHTFNTTTGSCSGNRDGTSAYEPGSGSTIMAYAGICGVANLQGNSDDYFHTISYDEIDSYTSTSPGNVGAATPTGNSVPVIAALTNRTIPQKTPFALTASATDANPEDVLTYCWEEFDKGVAQNPTVNPRDNGSSPIFRSFDPSRSPTRLFPSLTYILDDANLPPATVDAFASGEFWPTTNRTMTFRVTVRDNRPGGGGSNYASMTVTSTTAAGPFAITSHNTATTIAGGSTQTVTWSVAGTTAAPVNCANVKISLSSDGGHTWPFVLAASTPNDGSEAVTIPNVAHVATTQGRIKVEAVGNIFFDISGANLFITSTNTAPTLNVTGDITVQRGSLAPVSAAVATVSDANTPLSVAISEAPADTTLSASIVDGKVMISALADCSLVTTLSSRTYPFLITVTDSLGSQKSAQVNLVVEPNPAPTVGSYANQTMGRSGSATVTPQAAPADANGNLGSSPVGVSPATLPGGGTLVANQGTGAIAITTSSTTTPGTYPVKVTVQDECGAAVVKSFNLTVTSGFAPAFTSAPPPPGKAGVAYTHTFSASGAPPPAFSLASGTLPPGLVLSGATLSGTPTTPGVYPGIVVAASNGLPPDATQSFTLSIADTFEHYIGAYGLPPAQTSATADPDGDGLSNLAEYGMNLSATVPAGASQPPVVVKNYSGTNYLSMTFIRMMTATDLVYTVQASSDLVAWADLATSTAGATTSGPGLVGENGAGPAISVEVRDTVPVATPAEPKRFLRLKITRVP